MLRAGPSANASVGSCTFTSIYASFPLKLLHPRGSSQDASVRVAKLRELTAASANAAKAVAALYVVGYGGGLVSGDSVSLDVDVGHHCTLLMLTQGSTKVFKMRSSRSIDASLPGLSTRQTFRLLVRPNATLILLPDPVTCFAKSRYVQVQRVDVRCSRTSSLVLLDWYTPGRVHLAAAAAGEAWAFDSYRSRNEVRVGTFLLARDVVHLSQDEEGLPSSLLDVDAQSGAAKTPLARRCEPYTCYAMLILVGPDCQRAIAELKTRWLQVQQRVVPAVRAGVKTSPEAVLWSFSLLPIPTSAIRSEDTTAKQEEPIPDAAILRLAGAETQVVRDWLRDNLSPLMLHVGEDLYRQALG